MPSQPVSTFLEASIPKFGALHRLRRPALRVAPRRQSAKLESEALARVDADDLSSDRASRRRSG
jgi:hypothetical protein